MLYRTVNYLQHVREGWGGLRTIMAQTAGRCRLPAAHANCAARVHAFRYTHVRHTHTHIRGRHRLPMRPCTTTLHINNNNNLDL